MEKLDNKTRLAVLNAMLKSMRRTEWYICCRIKSYMTGTLGINCPGDMCDTDYSLYHFPELLGYKPKGVDLYSHTGWFNYPSPSLKFSSGQRIEVIESLIAEIEAQTEEEAI